MSQISRKSTSLPANAAHPGAFQRRFPWLYAFWKFSRPHTIIGTSLSVLALGTIATSEVGGADLGQIVLVLLFALLACLCGNVYIVGLNQLEDIDIDRINKPHLPLASGEFSRPEALRIVIVTGALAIALSLSQGIFLFATVGLSLIIGTAYSLPPIRLKRFPVWASLCIFTVRGVIVNLGLFLHFQQKLGGATQIPPSVWALTLFILGFTFAIAIYKDIPDLEGDRRYRINTFTLRLGAKTVFNLARWVITVCYGAMAIAGFWLPGVNGLFLTTTHLLGVGILWWGTRAVDLSDRGAIARSYQFIWKLFFLEYLIFPVACLLQEHH